MTRENEKGFTLTELLLVIALFAFVVGLSIPVYSNFQTRTDLNVTANVLASTIRRAQLLSKGVQNDSQWGVRVSNDAITLFAGSTYDLRNANFDETVNISGGVSFVAEDEVVFERFTGRLPSAASLQLVSAGNDTKTITVSTEGVVDVQ